MDRTSRYMRPGIYAVMAVAALVFAGLTVFGDRAGARLPLAAMPAAVLNTATATPTACPTGGQYRVVSSTGSVIIPGITDTGNHCDDCTTAIALPFPVLLYDQTFTTARVSSNGNLQFLSNNASGNNHCLPRADFNFAIFALWDNLDTSAAGNGIYTVVTGVAPDRIFNIEWRGHSYSGNGPVNFEIQLFENPAMQQFNIIFGALAQPGNSATVGVQRDTGSMYTQFNCNSSGGLT